MAFRRSPTVGNRISDTAYKARYGVLASAEIAAKSAMAAAEIATRASLVAIEVGARVAMAATEQAVRASLWPITFPVRTARIVSGTVDDLLEAGDRHLDEVMKSRPARFATYAGSTAMVGAGAYIGYKVGMPQGGNEWLTAGGAVELTAGGLGVAANVAVIRAHQ